jgi:hypothetical protein
VIQLIVELIAAPLLVAISDLAARRWGPSVGGTVGAFPVIVGPVLLIDALSHGERFAAQAAQGTLLGLVALAAFMLAYGRVAAHAGWVRSLAAGWLAAGVSAVALERTGGASSGAGALLAAAAALLVAYFGLRGQAAAPAVGPAPPQRAGRSLLLRMAATAALVTALAACASLFGALVGGMLAALPVLASVLAVCAHRQQGPGTALALLRGMLVGMTGFVAFCEILALALVAHGKAEAFLLATVAAVLAQTLSVRRGLSAREPLEDHR